ncbi:cytochrome c oxidase subunit 3 family protein [Marinigracilibium pacificum]|uniref:Heme-copper oxidase subunit III family profile domain-containing protein n=1 Tax=Marinigracilibium pacificum TaxID=2729599 RepID=A0A848IRC9_9BACT|nr:hypothetical protein [Marinigracilibium pacificum]NMM47023.1 hypothetical protein [Marinigracilibium pacificum]
MKGKVYKTSADQNTSLSTIEKIESLHPYQTITYLSIFGSSLIFVFLLVVLFVSSSHSDKVIEIPVTFYLSTGFLVFSHYFISKLPKFFDEENDLNIKRYLGFGILFTALFGVSQLFAWISLFNDQIYFDGKAVETMLYLLSGLHLLHIIAGLVFMISLFISCLTSLSDPVKNLIYFTNPFQKMKLSLLHAFWVFMDVSWIFILGTFIMMILV